LLWFWCICDFFLKHCYGCVHFKFFSMACDFLWASMMTRRRGCLWFFGWNPLVKIEFSSPLGSCFHNNSPQQIGFPITGAFGTCWWRCSNNNCIILEVMWNVPVRGGPIWQGVSLVWWETVFCSFVLYPWAAMIITPGNAIMQGHYLRPKHKQWSNMFFCPLPEKFAKELWEITF
jgi:hypothetical protein